MISLNVRLTRPQNVRVAGKTLLLVVYMMVFEIDLPLNQ